VEYWLASFLLIAVLRYCCLGILLVASLTACGRGVWLIASRTKTQDDETGAQKQESSVGPIILTAVGGLSFLLIVFGIWGCNYLARRSAEARVIVECQEAFLSDSYKLDFVERQDGTFFAELEEFSIEQDSIRWPVSGIIQLAIVDNYVVGEEDSGYWFMVNLDQAQSEHLFPSEEILLAELAQIGITQEPEFISAMTYCDTNPCQPCSTWPYGTVTPP
jgi:hypothetical protein